jgi:hypothetical protein
MVEPIIKSQLSKILASGTITQKQVRCVRFFVRMSERDIAGMGAVNAAIYD